MDKYTYIHIHIWDQCNIDLCIELTGENGKGLASDEGVVVPRSVAFHARGNRWGVDVVGPSFILSHKPRLAQKDTDPI